MSLLKREALPYPTYSDMIDHILDYVQERFDTPLEELIQNINKNQQKRIETLVRLAYKDLHIVYFTYDEMKEILGTDEPLKTLEGNPSVLFTLLVPIFNIIEDEETKEKRISIEMSLDYQILN